MQQQAPPLPVSLTQRAATAALLLFAWSLPTSIFGMQAGAGAMLLVLAAAFAWRRFRPSGSPLDLAIGALVGAILLSLLLAGSAPASLRSATSFWVFSAYFLVWFVLQTDTERTLRRAVGGMILLAALACLLGVWQAGSGTYPGTELMHPGMDVSKRLVPISNRPAAIGFFFARLTFAHVMLFAFCWALSLALASGLGRKRLFYLAACPVLAAVIFAAQGRIAWAAALAAALVLCFWYWRKRRLLIAGAAVLALAALALLPGPAARLRQSFAGGKDWTRLVIWRSALELAASGRSPAWAGETSSAGPGRSSSRRCESWKSRAFRPTSPGRTATCFPCWPRPAWWGWRPSA